MTPQEAVAANALLAGQEPREIINWCVQRFGPRLAMSTSFGPNSGVLIHIVFKLLGLRLPLFFIDPGDTPLSNLAYGAMLCDEFGIPCLYHFPLPPATKEEREQLRAGGAARLEAYKRLKVAPFESVMRGNGYAAVLHGARADQADDRNFSVLEPRDDGSFVQVYPLVGMSNVDAGAHLLRYDLPVHPDGLPGGGRKGCGIHRKRT